MNTEGMEVKKDAGSSVTDTSSVKAEITGTEAEVDASAVTEKTDTTEDKGPVPYVRFKEVNEEKKKAQEEFQAYKKKNEYWENFEAIVNESPEFADEIDKVIGKFQKGELTKKEVQAEIKDIKAEQSKGEPIIRDMLFNMYNNEFDKLASKDYTDTDDIRTIGYATGKILMEKFPKAKDRFMPQYVAEAYKIAKEEFEGYAQRRLKSYTDKKSDDGVPDSKSGTSVSTEPQFNSREDEARYIAEGLSKLK